MRLTFDSEKRRRTLEERGLDFLDVEFVFEGDYLTVRDERKDYGEQRFQTVGFLRGRMVMIVWTPRRDALHVISMRKCNEKEQKRYSKRFEAG